MIDNQNYLYNFYVALKFTVIPMQNNLKPLFDISTVTTSTHIINILFTHILN